MKSLAHPSFRDTLRACRHGWAVQRHTVGALIMRELHTRYGRDNVGYLWMILEPMLLAVMVAILHVGEGMHFGSDIRTVPFAVLGYCYFIIFRQIFLRAEGTIESNAPLLYHRSVTIFDMLLARALLDGAGVSSTFFILIFFSYMLGLGDLPQRWFYIFVALLLIIWFSWAASMVVCGLTHQYKLLAKFVHPFSYILMPVSGAFFMLKWLPPKISYWLSWNPMTQIFEMARYGQFYSANLHYVNVIYIVGCCMSLTYIGLLLVKIVRRHVNLN